MLPDMKPTLEILEDRFVPSAPSYHGGLVLQNPAVSTVFLGQYNATWPQAASAATVAANTAWLNDLYASLRPAASGFAYQNYIDPALAGWEDAYYGSNLARLRQVRAAYDPDGVFSFAQGIP